MKFEISPDRLSIAINRGNGNRHLDKAPRSSYLFAPYWYKTALSNRCPKCRELRFQRVLDITIRWFGCNSCDFNIARTVTPTETRNKIEYWANWTPAFDVPGNQQFLVSPVNQTWSVIGGSLPAILQNFVVPASIGAEGLSADWMGMLQSAFSPAIRVRGASVPQRYAIASDHPGSILILLHTSFNTTIQRLVVATGYNIFAESRNRLIGPSCQLPNILTCLAARATRIFQNGDSDNSPWTTISRDITEVPIAAVKAVPFFAKLFTTSHDPMVIAKAKQEIATLFGIHSKRAAKLMGV